MTRSRKPKPYWLVTRVKTAREDYAARNIKRQGFEYYLPRFFDKRLKRRRALFPGYMFVNSPNKTWMWLESTYGCSGVVVFGDTAATVPASFIRDMRAAENRNGMITVESVTEFMLNQNLRVSDGPFKGQIGKFLHYSDDKRICILFSILGKQVPMEIPDVLVEKAA